MNDLTQRQIEILQAIINEYTERGEPVGSEVLEKKYKLGISPATVRNEMVVLAKRGYLKKTHFSSGRVPSAKAFRFYIQHLMKRKELSTFDEVAYKNSVWDERDNINRLLLHATRVLAHRTGLLSVAINSFGDVYYAGMGNIFSKTELCNIEISRNIFYLIDEANFWNNILKQFTIDGDTVVYMLGEEDFQNPFLELCASIFGQFSSNSIRGAIGLIGPKRMSYDVIVPQVEHLSRLIQEIIREREQKAIS